MSLPITRSLSPAWRAAREAVHPGAAAQIDDGLAWLDAGKVEVVADASEGVDRLGRDRVELCLRVAEALCERAACFRSGIP